MGKNKIFLTIFGILALASLSIVPRVADVTSAHDCYAWDMGRCSSRNTPQYMDSYVLKDHRDSSWFSNPAYIQQSPQLAPNSNCTYSTNINWSVPGSSTATVTVLNPETNQEQTFATGSSGSQTANWIQPNKSYRFTLWDQNRNVVAQTWVSGTGRDCGTQNANYPSAYNNYPQQPTYQQQYPGNNNYGNNYYPANNYYNQNNYPSNTASGNFLGSTTPFNAYQVVNGQVVSNAWPEDPLDRSIPPEVYYRFCPTFAPC